MSDGTPADLVVCDVCKQQVFAQPRAFGYPIDVVLVAPLSHPAPCGGLCFGSVPAWDYAKSAFYERDEPPEELLPPGTKPADYCRHAPWQFCDERAARCGPLPQRARRRRRRK